MILLKNSIVDRIAYALPINSEANSSKVVPFGLNYAGTEFYQESYPRGDIVQEPLPWVIDFCKEMKKGGDFFIFQTENEQVHVLAHANVNEHYLIECFALALLADIFLKIAHMNGSSFDVEPNLMRAIDTLNGANNWNSLVGLLDIKHKAFICRQQARLSSQHYKAIHPEPILALANLYGMKVHTSAYGHVSDRVRKESNKLVFSFLKESFFK